VDIRRGLVVLAVVVAVSSMLGSVALAHHARSAYSEEDVMLEGVVVGFTWRNPHVQLAFDVTDENGKTETWRGELSAVTSMIAAGLNRNTFKAGDAVTVEARIANSGEPFAVLGSLWKDGTKVLDGEYRSETR
jgi:hypothetical protein